MAYPPNGGRQSLPEIRKTGKSPCFGLSPQRLLPCVQSRIPSIPPFLPSSHEQVYVEALNRRGACPCQVTSASQSLAMSSRQYLLGIALIVLPCTPHDAAQYVPLGSLV